MRAVSERAVFFLNTAAWEPLWQATSLALTAAAMGDEVIVVVAFDALRALASGAFGQPATDADRAAAQRAERINAATPQRMLADARALGAKLLACDTTVRLSGLESAALEQAKIVDEVLGLAQLWRLTRSARVLTW